ncbi:MAG: sugar phosphate isomerase/epimerase [Chloroflexi bacterium]|nr:MAG: sugar phosphate isomerase/epimerase [Chloroflexota bacterium]
MDKSQFGVQLYTLRSITATDMLGTLGRAAEAGYGAVEFAGFGGVPVSTLRARLDELNLRAAGAHVQYTEFDSDVKRVCEDVLTLGGEYAIVPAIPRDMRTDPSTARELPARLEQWAKACHNAGLRFAYHNHDFEFAPLGNTGGTIFDALLTTDPSVVDLELDVFWAAYAGRDPLALIREHRDRIRLLHLKDIAPGQTPPDVPVGRGTLDWDAILDAGGGAGVRWYIVEQDNPRDPLDDITQSARYLQRHIRT